MKKLLAVVLVLALPCAAGAFFFSPGGSSGSGVSSYTDVVSKFGGGSCSGYLKDDGTCETPAGTGDMTKAVYDTGDDGQIDNAALADAIVGQGGLATLDNGALDNNYICRWVSSTLECATLSFVNPSFSTINVYGANALNLGTGSSIAGSVRFKNATNNFYFQILGGVSGADIGWILPTAAPGGANYLLNVDADGTMGYTDPASIGGGTGTVTGPASATEDNVVVWGADNVSIKDSGIALSALAPLASPTFTGTVVIPTPFTLGAISVTPTGTELNFVDGVTSAIQDQLDAKAPLVSPSFTTPTLGVAAATTLNTGQGNYELYAMDQNVRTTDNVTFARITFDEATSTCVPADNNCGQTATNVGSPAGANLSAGLQWFDNTTQCFMIRNNDNTANITMSCLTKTFAFGIDNVIDGDDILLWKVPRALTITQVDCYASTDNVVGVLQECTAGDVTSCTDVDDTDWTVTNATSGFSVNSGFENASIAAGAWLKWVTTSEGTTNSNKLSCTVQYRE